MVSGMRFEKELQWTDESGCEAVRVRLLFSQNELRLQYLSVGVYLFHHEFQWLTDLELDSFIECMLLLQPGQHTPSDTLLKMLFTPITHISHTLRSQSSTTYINYIDWKVMYRLSKATTSFMNWTSPLSPDTSSKLTKWPKAKASLIATNFNNYSLT